MRFLKEHLWPVIAGVFGALWVIYGLVSGAYDLWTAGLSPAIWTIIGAVIFFASVAFLLYRFEERIAVSSVSVAQKSAEQATPATVASGSMATRSIFKNEELRVWDVAARGDQIIRNKVFQECVFYGPCVIAFLDGTYFDSNTFDTDDLEKHLIEVPSRAIVGVFGFEHCRFERCRFKQIAILGTKPQLDKLREAAK